MPERCVAGFCSNTRADGVSLFTFPKDPIRRSKWTRQVQRTRAKWMPSNSSVLCSAHFEDTCFDASPQLKESLGLGVYWRRVLLPSAVPTIFPPPRPGASQNAGTDVDGSTKKPRRRSTVDKRAKLTPEDAHWDMATQVAAESRPPSRTVSTQYRRRCPYKEHLPPQQQSRNSMMEDIKKDVDPQLLVIKDEKGAPQPLYIKEEEAHHSISQEGEHLEGLEEFPVIVISVKSEDN
uniref:peroxynitrite isomerase THAP4-like isoform X2 n=1 Tax=Doryrhamphus excisus TaxID=161450 RepID=UPI0025AEA6E4|nr:peroxynitrite isomerase THAP4-like isoform X2 [Doryrhamphus excisus]